MDDVLFNELKNRDETVDTKIIMITSGKGGVGKSFIAVNLAVLLAKNDKSVLLFDADVGFANGEILLGVTPRNTLKDYLMEKRDLKDIVYPTKYGVWLLSGGTDVRDIIAFKGKRKDDFMGDFMKLVENMDYIIIDTGIGYMDDLRGLYEAVDLLILVITQEPTSLMNTYTLAKLLALRGIEPEIHMIMNMVRNVGGARRTMEKFIMVLERFAGIEVSEQYIMKYDRSVKDSIIKQTPLVELSKHSQPSLCLHRLGESILSMEIKRGKIGFIEKMRSLLGIGR